MDWLAHEPLLRSGGFALVLVALFLIQRRWPARNDGRLSKRQAVNLSLVVIDTLLLRLAFPVLAVGFALTVHGGGLLGLVSWPGWLEFLLAILVLDLVIYWQHRLLHAVPVLWRMHRVHHADTGFDVTTGVRFHPLEIALSMGIKIGVIFILGPHPLAVLAFELMLSLGSLFTHADFALPKGLDRRLRWLVVTPSMHRIHHSTWRPETDSNYGFHLSVWDRLFGSYTTEPREDERRMPIGLERFREPSEQTLWQLLINPFRRRPSTPDRSNA